MDTTMMTTALVSVQSREQPLATLNDDADTKQRVALARKELDINNTQSLAFFGSKAQSGLTDMASKMIAGVRNKDVAPAAESLSRVVAAIRGFSLDDLAYPGMVSKFVNKLMRGVTPVVAALQRYETVESQINAIISEMDRHISVLMKDVVSLDRMYSETLASFYRLKIYVAAGEEELEELRTARLPAMREAAQGDTFKSQEVAKIEGVAQRLERHLHDLKMTQQITLQSLPEIMGMQDNDIDLVQKMWSSIVNTVPLWKQRIAMLITAHHAEAAAGPMKGLTDITNEMLVSTAKAIQTANKVVRAEVERGSFDLEAIRQANDIAIATLTESRELYKVASARRQEEAQALLTYEAEIQKVMVA